LLTSENSSGYAVSIENTGGIPLQKYRASKRAVVHKPSHEQELPGLKMPSAARLPHRIPANISYPVLDICSIHLVYIEYALEGIGKLTLLDLEIRVSRFMALPYSTLQTHSS
jgi:hypothetical protein